MKQTIVLTESPPNKASVTAIPGRSDPSACHRPRRAVRAGKRIAVAIPTGYLGQFHRFKSKLHFQEVLGFAAALTAAAGFLLDKLPESRRKEFARRSLIQRRSGSGSRLSANLFVTLQMNSEDPDRR